VIINNILGVFAAVLFVSSRHAGSVEMLLLARLVVGLSSGEYLLALFNAGCV
jgi:hypothetical protein